MADQLDKRRGEAAADRGAEEPQLRLAGGPEIDRLSADEYDLAKVTANDYLGSHAVQGRIADAWGRGQSGSPSDERVAQEMLLGPVQLDAMRYISDRLAERGLPAELVGSMRGKLAA